jgi:hypothetical protein
MTKGMTRMLQQDRPLVLAGDLTAGSA